MEKPWLIQRLEKPINRDNIMAKMAEAFSFGGGLKDGGLSEKGKELIRDMFWFDYMGSAEFEWGAVPKALNKIARNRDKLIAFGIKCKTREEKEMMVWVICNKDIREDVEKWILKKAFNEKGDGVETKERVLLQDAINNGGCAGIVSRICGWLEIGEGFFFFTDKDMFEETRRLFVE